MSATFTAEQLAQFNGGSSPIYISVKGKVYDCSKGNAFYGQGAPYQFFSGKEVSRCLAKMQLNSSEANSGWDNLSEEHQKTLKDWVEKYESKYPVVGTFQPDSDFKKRGDQFDP